MLGFEGFVLKPDLIDPETKIAPYLKCRNSEYLRIIYGHDYQDETKYRKLFSKKRIERKVRMSIDEFVLGYKLLSIPYSELNQDNPEHLKIVCQLISEMENEKVLDPRL